MDNIITETNGDRVTVSPVPGKRQAFKDAAAALLDAGPVDTVTGPQGIALQVSADTAKKAGVVKATRRTRKKG